MAKSIPQSPEKDGETTSSTSTPIEEVTTKEQHALSFADYKNQRAGTKQKRQILRLEANLTNLIEQAKKERHAMARLETEITDLSTELEEKRNLVGKIDRMAARIENELRGLMTNLARREEDVGRLGGTARDKGQEERR